MAARPGFSLAIAPFWPTGMLGLRVAVGDGKLQTTPTVAQA